MNSPERLPVATISRQDWSFHRKGEEDEIRHNEKVKEAIKDNLPNIINDGNIITADPHSKQTIKIPMRSLELPRIRYKDGSEGVGTGKGEEGDGVGEPGDDKQAGNEPGEEYYEVEFTIEEIQKMVFEDMGLPHLKPKKMQEIQSEEVVFEDVRKKRSPANLDPIRTIIENMRRNAQETGKAEIKDIKPEDFRVRTWENEIKEENSAVVIAMADVSGSMGEFEKYITRAFCWWAVSFLTTKYPKVDIVYIAHDTQAREVTGQQFFTRGEGGGTNCSSANLLAIDIIKDRYNPENYNIYPMHFSDGDNWSDDNPRCVKAVQDLLDEMHVNQYAYVQIRTAYESGLLREYRQNIKDERFNGLIITTKEEVLPALKQVFKPDEI
jgi:uncharacterized protein